MIDHSSTLNWIDSQAGRMVDRVTRWANLNSGSRNLAGLARLADVLKTDFAVLGAAVEEIELAPERIIDSRGEPIESPLGKLLFLRKRPEARTRVLLGIHMDTVYGPDDPFQSVERLDDNTLRGPGVIDAKGGLAVMLTALEAIERSGAAGELGWEVFINPDEEIGSPGSAEFLRGRAAGCQFGMLFEPTMPDGSMVTERKGSGNFSAIVRGRAAHAGRDFHAGRNAVLAAAEFCVAADRINGRTSQATLNIGRIEGGGAVNVVPDLAIVRMNARVVRPEDRQTIEAELSSAATTVAARRDVSIELHGGFSSPPKVLDEPTLRFCERIERCGRELGLTVAWRTSGGASDGNRLAAAGLPVIDTFGPRGAGLHSPDEHLFLDSLVERAKLATLVLLRLANGPDA